MRKLFEATVEVVVLSRTCVLTLLASTALPDFTACVEVQRLTLVYMYIVT